MDFIFTIKQILQSITIHGYKLIKVIYKNLIKNRLPNKDVKDTIIPSTLHSYLSIVASNLRRIILNLSIINEDQ